MPSSRAISLLLAPRAMPRRMSRSRGDSCSIGDGGACGRGVARRRAGAAVGGDQLAGHLLGHHATRRASRAGWRRPARRLRWSSAGSRRRRRAAPRRGRCSSSLTVSIRMRAPGAASRSAGSASTPLTPGRWLSSRIRSGCSSARAALRLAGVGRVADDVRARRRAPAARSGRGGTACGRRPPGCGSARRRAWCRQCSVAAAGAASRGGCAGARPAAASAPPSVPCPGVEITSSVAPMRSARSAMMRRPTWVSSARRRRRLEADAVVAHLEAPLRLLLHVEPDRGGPRMLAHVGQRLLHDVQHLDLQVGRQRHARGPASAWLALRPLWCSNLRSVVCSAGSMSSALVRVRKCTSSSRTSP